MVLLVIGKLGQRSKSVLGAENQVCEQPVRGARFWSVDGHEPAKGRMCPGPTFGLML